MTDIRVLYADLRALPWPRLAARVGDFALYESLLAGCADRVADGQLIASESIPVPDDETLAFVKALRLKPARSRDEADFLAYFEITEEIRSALAAR
jgi:hypothetical protein